MLKPAFVWIVTVVAGILIGKVWFDLRSERQAAAVLQGTVTRLQSQIDQLQRLREPSASEEASKSVTTPPPPPSGPEVAPRKRQSAASSVAKSRSSKTWEEIDDWELRRLRDPNYREAWRTQRRLELKSGHVDLAKVLDVSAETADQIIELLVDWELAYLSEPHPNPRNNAEIASRQLEIQESNRRQDAELATLIGQEKLALWKVYQSSLESRQNVYTLRAELASTDPLRDEQVESLVSAISGEQEQFRQEIRNLGIEGTPDARANTYIERSVALRNRIHDAASAFLSSQQLTRLDGMLQRALDMQIARIRVEQANRVIATPPVVAESEPK
jgi:hypothetical protein